MPRISHPDLITDYGYSEDAGVYKIAKDQALVQTVDFFPPIVDDPYDFGRIAAANALSDVYAMGARPVTALSIVCFPTDKLEESVLNDILRGGMDAVREADAFILGGHSIKDGDVKFGLAVTGMVHPDRVWLNHTLRDGDRLILTKPLGNGIVNTALRGGVAAEESVTAATREMCRLNRQAAEIAALFDIHACTDVTGFGLLGHLCEMLASPTLDIEVRLAEIQLLPEVMDFAEAGVVPGGANANREYRIDRIANRGEVPIWWLDILFDPQTSGGLLFSLCESDAAHLLGLLRKAGINAYPVGSVGPGNGGITIVE